MVQHDETPKRDTGGVESGVARHGHVSYLEIPAIDAKQSAVFYEAVFGWSIRRRDNGDASFDDGSGGLIGRWVTGRAASREPGLVPYIYFDRIDEIVERVMTQGGEIDKPPYPQGDLLCPTFRHPAAHLI